MSHHLTMMLMVPLNAKRMISACMYQLTKYDLAKALIYAHKELGDRGCAICSNVRPLASGTCRQQHMRSTNG